MKPDLSAAAILWVVTLTLASQACSTLNNGGGQVRRLSCDFHVYRDLLALGDSHICTGESQVWRMLDHLYHQTDGPSCMKQAIMHLGGQFVDVRHSPEYCNCSGSSNPHRYTSGPNLTEHRHECWHDHSYASLYETHFTRRSQPAHAYNCTSHHAIWHTLASIGSDTCRNDIVLHVANIFITSGDQCSCGLHSSGKEVTQTIHTTNHITTSTKGPTDHCLNYESYKYLYNLGLDVRQCVSVNNMWQYLADLQHIDINCRKKIMEHMAAIFHDYNHSPTHCTCTGHASHHNTSHNANGDQTYCYKNHETYRLLHEEIYENSASLCRSHQYLWKLLRRITIGENKTDCRVVLILHAAATFPNTRTDSCSCTDGKEVTLHTTNHITTPTEGPTDHCLHYESYKYLYNLGLDIHQCVSVNNMWHYLADLQHKDINCRKKIMDHMAAIFHDYNNSPTYCTCTGPDIHHIIVHVPNGNQTHCSKSHDAYRLLHREIYENSPSPCRSHQYLWKKLLDIPINHDEMDCRADLILHAAATFPNTRNDPCSCTHGKEVTQTIHTMNHITTSTKGPTDHCLHYESYKYLYNLGLDVHQCVSVNNMWHYLADLQHQDINCRKMIMDHMAAIFHDYNNSPTYCTCTGPDIHHIIVHVPHGDQTYCHKSHEPYKLLHREIYENSPSPCRSHQYLWKKLLEITIGHNEMDCRADLILHAAATFPHTRDDPCSCTHAAASMTLSGTTRVAGHTTLSHTSTIKSTATSTTASTTSNKQATEHLPGFHVCNKALTISSIAYNLTVTHASASDCTTGDHTSSEALVLKNCNASSTTTWIKGENVKAICNSIPLFTPIATFNDTVFQPIGGKAGIFLGCLPDGFKIAVQDCHIGIRIKHIQAGAVGANDPANYFVIRW